VAVQLCSFLTLTLDGDEWSALCPRFFTAEGRAPLPIELEAEWTRNLVCIFVQEEDPLSSARNQTMIAKVVTVRRGLSLFGEESIWA